MGPQKSCYEGAEGIEVSLDGVEQRARALASGGVSGCKAEVDSRVVLPQKVSKGLESCPVQPFLLCGIPVTSAILPSRSCCFADFV